MAHPVHLGPRQPETPPPRHLDDRRVRLVALQIQLLERRGMIDRMLDELIALAAQERRRDD